MNKKSNETLKPQADRVEKLFPSKQETIPSSKPSLSSYAYQLLRLSLKSLRPFVLEMKKTHAKIKLKVRKLSHSDLGDDALHAQKCCANRKDFRVAHERAISPGRVKNWHLKEHHLVAKRLKNMKKRSQGGSVHYKVTLLEKKEVETCPDQQKTELWQELIKHNEERHFYLTRITKFLID